MLNAYGVNLQERIYDRDGYLPVSIFSVSLAITVLLPHVAIMFYWLIFGPRDWCGVPGISHGDLMLMLLGGMLITLLTASRYERLGNMINIMPRPFYRYANRSLYRPVQVAQLNFSVLCFLPFVVFYGCYLSSQSLCVRSINNLSLLGLTAFAVAPIVSRHVCLELSHNLQTLQGEELKAYRARVMGKIEAKRATISLYRFEAMDWFLEIAMLALFTYCFYEAINGRSVHFYCAFGVALLSALGRMVEVLLPRWVTEGGDTRIKRYARYIKALRLLLVLSVALLFWQAL